MQGAGNSAEKRVNIMYIPPQDGKDAHCSPSARLIELRNVTKVYESDAGSCVALRDINLRVAAGEFVAVMGKSGSGKSTLINMITGIDKPTSGEVWVGNTAVHRLAEGPMAQWRGRNIGVVFQFFQLLPTLSILENVMLPMDFCHLYTPHGRKKRALDLLDQLGLAEHALKLPSAISGGQQQRAAIARALATDPPLLAADEPTGNLDSQTAEQVLQMFVGLVNMGRTIVMVTHDMELAAQASRTIRLMDGSIVSDESNRMNNRA